MTKLAVVICTLIVLGCIAQAQTYSIKGIVDDPSRAPIKKARIEILRDQQGGVKVLASLTSDDDGEFSIDLPAGKYQACAAHEGFERTCSPFSLPESTRVNLTLPLVNTNAGIEVLKARLGTIAGHGAVDCGEVRSKADKSRTNRCALKAFQHHRAFFLHYEEWGIDSRIDLGIAGNSRGRLYEVRFDSLGMDGSAALHDDGHTLVKACGPNTTLALDKEGRLRCADAGEHGTED